MEMADSCRPRVQQPKEASREFVGSARGRRATTTRPMRGNAPDGSVRSRATVDVTQERDAVTVARMDAHADADSDATRRRSREDVSAASSQMKHKNITESL